MARIVVEYRQIEKLLQNLDCYCSEKEVRRLPGPNNPVSLGEAREWKLLFKPPVFMSHWLAIKVFVDMLYDLTQGTGLIQDIVSIC